MRFEQTPRGVCVTRDGPHVCTLRAGHDGDHQAHTDAGTVAHTWPPTQPKDAA
jgi:hypothetical protein